MFAHLSGSERMTAMKLDFEVSDEETRTIQIEESIEGHEEIKGFFTKANKVPDVERGILKVTGNKIRLCLNEVRIDAIGKWGDLLASDHQTDKSIVLLLESPHRQEYTKKPWHPIAPAQNAATHGRITQLPQLLESKTDIWESLASQSVRGNVEYPLVIANPIQWQASLARYYDKGLKSELRNEVWRELWNFKESNEYPLRADFLRRLKSYNPVVVINAFTGFSKVPRNDKKGLNKTLSKFLTDNRESFGGCKIIRTYHPSSKYWETFASAQVV
jgi:hypothetical protein